MDKNVGLGLIGAGAIGKVHAKNIHQNINNARLVAVADIDQKAATSLAQQFGNGKVYANYADLIHDKEVDAILVCTPPFLKLDITKLAAEAKKPVFCEKPISTNLADADQMVQIVEESGTTFQVGYQRRFDASYLKAKEAVDSGKLGRMLLIKEHNRDPPGPILGWSLNPKSSGGIFLDTTSHDFDAVRWLSGSEVTRVYADGDALIYEELGRNGDFDTVMVVMKLANGAVAYVDSCYHTVYGFDARLEILGTDAAVTVDMGEQSFARLHRTTGTSNEHFDGYATRWGQAYRDEIAGFADCVLSGGTPKATIKDGRAALQIGLAAKESIAQKRAVNLSS